MIRVPAQPGDFVFDPATTALVVIDMQRDFIEPGGFGESLGNDVSRLAAIVPTVAALLDLCRARSIAVIHTREAHRPDLSDCPPAKRARGTASLRIGDCGPMGRILVAGEAGNDILAAVAPRPGEIVIDKPGKGAFYATGLGEILRLRGITHLIFAGVTTEVCVQTTMREANDRGYDCLLVEDATESYFPEFKAATLAMIRAQGAIVGWTAPLAMLQAALAGGGNKVTVGTTAGGAAINLPHVVAELTAVFERYEAALIRNDVAVLDELFWNSPLTVRYGIGENLYGADAIRAYRAAFVPPANMPRSLRKLVITTYGEDFATADVEFLREGDPVGRQSQTWVRFARGWRVVSAHVSMLG